MNSNHHFHGAKREVIARLNELLTLPATGREQDWEIELADPKKVDPMLEMLELHELDLEHRSALALITIASLDEALEAGEDVCEKTRLLKYILERDQPLGERMRFFWVETFGGLHPEMTRSLFQE